MCTETYRWNSTSTFLFAVDLSLRNTQTLTCGTSDVWACQVVRWSQSRPEWPVVQLRKSFGGGRGGKGKRREGEEEGRGRGGKGRRGKEGSRRP